MVPSMMLPQPHPELLPGVCAITDYCTGSILTSCPRVQYCQPDAHLRKVSNLATQSAKACSHVQLVVAAVFVTSLHDFAVAS